MARPAVGATQRPVTHGTTPSSPELTGPREALRNFHHLKRAEQMQLAHELAVTRKVDLCLAFANLLSVGAGFRTRRDSPRSVPRLRREVCVSFVVTRKWLTAGRAGDPQVLPKFLLCFATVNGERVLCAVPTDVRAKSQYGKPRPHGDGPPMPFGVIVSRDGAEFAARGVLTCALRRPAFPGRTYALSCRHVFSRTLLDFDDEQTALPVLLNDANEPRVAGTTKTRGLLQDRSKFSFDAQLAEASPSQDLRKALSGLVFDPSDGLVLAPSEIGLGFWVATGRRDPAGGRLRVWVDYHGTVADFEMPYKRPDGTSLIVRHALVLHGASEEPLVAGDSGSPAVRVKSGQRLVGMYIGGDRVNVYILPAWQLFTPANFERRGETGWIIA